ncbi:nucleotidyl transferase AbiEii/AbiGii toxin family protein [Mucilaginibacter sp.]|uniref:nucleotidyl transferase AbiEii/AbiGii toxin family protein n=1 Tax=Mucilaginibacter sp. TaxID=1882438 RepID=UPI002847C78C|nr:nucleotidyl transferase AbiEii/AbiGii toxin family protein [Mucilaginibacter sp.]MDR3695816.1 nucleotidyl transferase AbiEii/AbiGii toxin family protein [Mucilaginibacter sp.]
MLRKETVSTSTLELLKDLMQDENLADFFLVGGTALSLQIGHRISIDLDLFSEKPFDENKMLIYLESKKSFRLDYQDRNTLKGQIAETKVDLISHTYPLVKPLVVIEEIRLASLEDIAAMKLNAIIGNGTRLKDFIDVAFLSSYLSLKTMMKAYEDKYTSRNPLLTLKALAYHQDINFYEPIHIIGGNYIWNAISKRLNEMEKYPEKVFEKPPFQ